MEGIGKRSLRIGSRVGKESYEGRLSRFYLKESDDPESGHDPDPETGHEIWSSL